MLKEFLKELGLEDRVRFEYVGVAMWNKLAKVIKSVYSKAEESKSEETVGKEVQAKGYE